jgi:hypothetical protein
MTGIEMPGNLEIPLVALEPVHSVRLALQVFKLKFLPYRVYTRNTQALQGKLTNRALLYFLIQELSFRRVRQALSCVPALSKHPQRPRCYAIHRRKEVSGMS